MTSTYHTVAQMGTHPGRKRRNNEDFADFFEPTRLEDLQASGDLYIVADGVGGAAKGEKASRYAAQKALFDYYLYPNIEPGERLVRVMRQVGNEIFDYAENRSNEGPMATTMVAAVVSGTKLIVASVGDSRAYLIRGGVARQLTEDHTDPGKRNKLTRSMGGELNVEVDVFNDIPLKTGDKILLCSDGLTRYVNRENLATLTAEGTPEAITNRLIEFANHSGGADNVTVILVEVGQPAEQEEILSERASRAARVGELDLQDRKTAPSEEMLAPQAPRRPILPGNVPLPEVPRQLHILVFVAVALCVVAVGLVVLMLTKRDISRVEQGVMGSATAATVEKQTEGAIFTQIWVGYTVTADTQTAEADLRVLASTSTQQAVEAFVNTQKAQEQARQTAAAILATQTAVAMQAGQTEAAIQSTQTAVAIQTAEALNALPTQTPSPNPDLTHTTGDYVCVKKVGDDNSLFSVLNQFSINFDRNVDYYHLDCYVIGLAAKAICQGVPTLIENPDVVNPIWWIWIKDVSQEKCEQNDGTWVPRPWR